ncbi:putative DBP5-RNA helicase [Phlyctochytrium arcticum]|nr:putative DBP5-RNA helicase [Phlyctochytrium arcticum]
MSGWDTKTDGNSGWGEASGGWGKSEPAAPKASQPAAAPQQSASQAKLQSDPAPPKSPERKEVPKEETAAKEEGEWETPATDVEKITKQVEELSTASDNARVVEVRLADLEADVNSPIYSAVSSFEDLGLHPDLLKGIYAMGFQRPSKIQETALPMLISNPPKNMIGQSQSGTGKTAAFVLTMLSRVSFTLQAPQALCLAPSRELARQIMDAVREMGKYTSVTTAFAIKDSVPRGTNVTEHIVVGTPGTVWDLMKRRALDVSNMRIFVLDEADNMLDQQGLGDQSLRVKLFPSMPTDCQIVLFSATFPSAVRQFAAKFAPNSNMISLRQEELSVEGIKQFYMDCKSEEHKTEVLCALYGLLTIGQSIIFCRQRQDAVRLGEALTAQGHVCVVLHGGFDPAERDQAMNDFRDGKFKVLITTNVIARGIDILQVNLVINFDMPVDVYHRPDFETYLHRIGRTGRFGRTGVSINFVHNEGSYTQMKAIEDHFKREIIRVPTDSYMEIETILKKAVK